MATAAVTVQREVIFVSAAPHGRAVLRLVPDFPITDVVVKTVRPAVVVVPDETKADFRPFRGILGRMHEALLRSVLDTLAQSVNDLRAGLPDRSHIPICEREVVARRLRRVGIEIGEDGVDVHHVRIGPVTIVQPGDGHIERTKSGGNVNHAAGGQRPFVDPVQRAHQSVGREKIHMQFPR